MSRTPGLTPSLQGSLDANGRFCGILAQARLSEPGAAEKRAGRATCERESALMRSSSVLPLSSLNGHAGSSVQPTRNVGATGSIWRPGCLVFRPRLEDFESCARLTRTSPQRELPSHNCQVCQLGAIRPPMASESTTRSHLGPGFSAAVRLSSGNHTAECAGRSFDPVESGARKIRALLKRCLGELWPGASPAGA